MFYFIWSPQHCESGKLYTNEETEAQEGRGVKGLSVKVLSTTGTFIAPLFIITIQASLSWKLHCHEWYSKSDLMSKDMKN